MKLIRQVSRNGGVIVVSLLLALLAFGVVSCAAHRGLEVVPLHSNRTDKASSNVLTLSSDDIVRVMRQAGFSDNQILEYGTDLHSALSQAGAAQIKIRNRLEAIFAINGDAVYISSRLMKRNFIYNVKTGWVGVE